MCRPESLKNFPLIYDQNCNNLRPCLQLDYPKSFVLAMISLGVWAYHVYDLTLDPSLTFEWTCLISVGIGELTFSLTGKKLEDHRKKSCWIVSHLKMQGGLSQSTRLTESLGFLGTRLGHRSKPRDFTLDGSEIPEGVWKRILFFICVALLLPEFCQRQGFEEAKVRRERRD